MDRELFSEVSGIVAQIHDQTPIKSQFTDSDIVLAYLWAVRHDRPVSWACRSRNWPLWARRRRFPSEPTMSRRLRTPSVLALLDQIECCCQPRATDAALIIDSKPLPVGEHTKDKDAHTGYACGVMAHGYKLHLICDPAGHVHAWSIRPMNTAEPVVACELLEHLTVRGTWLLGDSAYDSNNLHRRANELGLQLIAPRKRPRTGLGHRSHNPSRLRSMKITESPNSVLYNDLRRKRDCIERFFGNLTSYGGGLSPLPAWVRTLPRVRRWVQAKLILNAIRIRQRARLCA